MAYRNELIFTEAIAQVSAILESNDEEEIASRIEQLAGIPDLATAAMMILLFKAKGADISKINGIDLANPKFTASDLILPPGVTL